jgi:cyanophycinase
MSDCGVEQAAGGVLVIIGGHEQKKGERTILREVARWLKGGKLVVATIASHEPQGYFESYQQGFEGLGVGELTEVYVEDRAQACDPDKLRAFDDAAGVFFTGGDQLRITSQIGSTPLERRIREIYARRGVVAGTSAGASVMPETMLVRGSGRESYRLGDLDMAPGLGLIGGVIVDQHFAERGRIGRLLGAVAKNPRLLGIGIDEDTAIVVKGERFDVIGNGAVYVVDGAGVTHSNIAEQCPNRTLSITDLRMHVLASGDKFDLGKRRPSAAPDVEESQRLERETLIALEI